MKQLKWLFVVLVLITMVFPSTLVWASRGEEEEESEMEAAAPAPEEELKREFRVAFWWPTYIDPAVGSDFSSLSCLLNMYDSLVWPTPEGDVEPRMAERWEVSGDGLTWTFTLRKDLTFHDGSEVTAEDVAFSMNRLLTIGEGVAYLFLPYVNEAEAVDKYTVRFKMKKTYGPFLSALVRFYVLNKDIVMANLKADGPYGDFGDYGKEFLLYNDAGSGAYKLKKMELQEYCLMERYDDFYLGFEPNAPDEVKFMASAEPATVKAMMARQELEVSDQWQSPQALEALDGIEGVDIAYVYLGQVFHGMLHCRKPPTDDVHFRKALQWAFDYDSQRENIVKGGKPLVGPYTDDIQGTDPGLPTFSKNLDKAEAEYKKSKYYDKLDQYPLEIHAVAGLAQHERTSLLLQSNLAEIGIKANVVKVPWGTVIENSANMEKTGNVSSIFVAPIYFEVGSYLLSRYHSSSAATWEQNEWLLSDELDGMIEDAIATVDRNERFNKYSRVLDTIVELAPTIWYAEPPATHAYQASYMNWPAAEGMPMPKGLGYAFEARNIQIFPENRKY
jgi:peptide/nickel transport system substrate-binding protein